MKPSPSTATEAVQYELRFAHLFKAGRGYSFPCDAKGTVNLDLLSEAGRNSYFYARGLVGRELSAPFTAPIEHTIISRYA